MRFLSAVVLLALSAATGGAQPGAWDKLREIERGTQIRVQVADGQRIQGAFESADSASLIVLQTSGHSSLPRAGIREVRIRKAGHRGRNTLIGLGIGTAGGLAAGAAVDAKDKTSFFPNAGKIAFTPIGAIIGTVIGVAMPTGGWSAIYRTP